MKFPPSHPSPTPSPSDAGAASPPLRALPQWRLQDLYASMDDPNFAGGKFSYWQRQQISLLGVNLTNRFSLLPDLRASKSEGQANFVNPGLELINIGMDFALTQKLKPEEWARLFGATQNTLREWIGRLRAEAERDFPEKVTAFRKEMAVHGRYGKPCPRCGEPVQRIRYADNETNYCARCQTGGRLLADRGLSRLLGADWPRTLDELEGLKRR